MGRGWSAGLVKVISWGDLTTTLNSDWAPLIRGMFPAVLIFRMQVPTPVKAMFAPVWYCP